MDCRTFDGIFVYGSHDGWHDCSGLMYLGGAICHLQVDKVASLITDQLSVEKLFRKLYEERSPNV